MSEETERKITAPLAAVPEWAAELTVAVRSGFERTEARFDGIEERMVKVETNGDSNGQMLQNLQQRLTLVEGRTDKLESRASRNSDRAKSAALTDDKHDAAIATLNTKLDVNTHKTEQALAILERLDKVAANPMVRRIAYAVGLALLAWLAAHAKGMM